MGESIAIAVAGGSWVAWCYWKRCERARRRKIDSEYWAKVRRECPSCAARRKARQCQTSTA